MWKCTKLLHQRCSFWEQSEDKWLAQSTDDGSPQISTKKSWLGTKLICSDLICNDHRKKLVVVVDWLDWLMVMVGKVWLWAKYRDRQQKRDRGRKCEKKRQKLWKTVNNMCFENSEMTSREGLKIVWRMTSRNKNRSLPSQKFSEDSDFGISNEKRKSPVSEKVWCSRVTITQCTTGMLGLLLRVC